MQDTHTLKSTMDGQPYTAGHHAATLRRMLWREHLGLISAQDLDASNDPNAQPPGDGENVWQEGQYDEWDRLVADPLSDELWKMWTERATTNTEVFRVLFHADPDDHSTFRPGSCSLPSALPHRLHHFYSTHEPFWRLPASPPPE